MFVILIFILFIRLLQMRVWIADTYNMYDHVICGSTDAEQCAYGFATYTQKKLDKQTNTKSWFTFRLFDFPYSSFSVQFQCEIGHFALERSTHSEYGWKRRCNDESTRRNTQCGAEKKLLT